MKKCLAAIKYKKWPSFCVSFFLILTSTQAVVKLTENFSKNEKIQLSFRDNQVRHKRGRNAMEYKVKCLRIKDHFDTSGVFEISKFDISKLACMS